MSTDLTPVIAATARWLLHAYPATGGAFSATLAEAQARQAATVAAFLRYPTELDASLLDVVGPGGSGRLDWVTGLDTTDDLDGEDAWRCWVDEVVASWAACLLADSDLAATAAAAVGGSPHLAGLRCDFRRLTQPGEHDSQAAVLLRHPDLLAPVADLHATELQERLSTGSAEAA